MAPRDNTTSPSNQPILLPWDLCSYKGFHVTTEIKASSIPEAGLGRYATQPIANGNVVRAEPIKTVEEYIAMGGTREQATVALVFHSEHDFERLSDYWIARGADEHETKKMISWYVASVPNHRTDLEAKSECQGVLCYLLAHSFKTNHAKPANMETVVNNGILFHKAITDIPVGEELMLDYTTMTMPEFCKQWCHQNGLKDVDTMAKEIEGQIEVSSA